MHRIKSENTKGVSSGSEESTSEPVSNLDRICHIFEESDVACEVSNGRREIIFVNQACAALYGCKRDELIGQTPDKFSQGDETAEAAIEKMRAKTANGAPSGYTIQNTRSNGEVYVAGVFIIPFVDGPNSTPYYLGVSRELESKSESVTKGGPPEFRKMIEDLLAIVGA